MVARRGSRRRPRDAPGEGFFTLRIRLAQAACSGRKSRRQVLGTVSWERGRPARTFHSRALRPNAGETPAFPGELFPGRMDSRFRGNDEDGCGTPVLSGSPSSGTIVSARDTPFPGLPSSETPVPSRDTPFSGGPWREACAGGTPASAGRAVPRTPRPGRAVRLDTWPRGRHEEALRPGGGRTARRGSPGDPAPPKAPAAAPPSGGSPHPREDPRPFSGSSPAPRRGGTRRDRPEGPGPPRGAPAGRTPRTLLRRSGARRRR